MKTLLNTPYLSFQTLIERFHLKPFSSSPSFPPPFVARLAVSLQSLFTYQSKPPQGLITFVTDERLIPSLNSLNFEGDGDFFIGVIVDEKLAKSIKPKPYLLVLIHPNPRVCFDKVALVLNPPKEPHISPSAHIEKGAVIEKGCSIGAGCYIDASVVLGDGCVIYPNVTLLSKVKLGHGCIIHSGTVVGSDGFGYMMNQGRAHKNPQIGGVRIGNFVEIGSNCSIDRGTLDDTIIEDEVKIDNLVHIAHNVVIGSQSAIMGSCAIAGRAKIGKRCRLFGQVGVAGDVSIADDVTILAKGGVSKSITESHSVWAGFMRLQKQRDWHKQMAHLGQIDNLKKKIKSLENELAQLKKL